MQKMFDKSRGHQCDPKTLQDFSVTFTYLLVFPTKKGGLEEGCSLHDLETLSPLPFFLCMSQLTIVVPGLKTLLKLPKQTNYLLIVHSSELFLFLGSPA